MASPLLKPTIFILLCLAAVAIGCQAKEKTASQQPVTVKRFVLLSGDSCSGRFVSHELDHFTQINGDEITMFDSNGAGLAINDLDNDGNLDIVLANLAGPNTILWNEGLLNFRTETLEHGQSRSASIVDVDGDSRFDIVFTRQWSGPTYWRNEGDKFENRFLNDVSRQAYALNWGDFDQDGDLDLVTVSYDAALEKDLGNSFMLGAGAGVFVYTHENGEFIPERLADSSQGLVALWHDVNQDGYLDILVGNDFAVPDQVWLRQGNHWTATEPFSETTHSTMSFDSGDINNDGRPELLAADMKPYASDPQTLAAWQNVMDQMMHGEVEEDLQIMENVLQVPGQNGRYQNQARSFGLQATGWSWSSKFGDLDNDGFLDIYVVNGMAAAELFGQLVDSELIEENQALRNVNGQAFVPAPEWGLNATEGGRGMSMADLDNDGDLDIVVNNLRAPARLFENQLCGGKGIEVDLFWPASGNSRALGAQVFLNTSAGLQMRDVRANSGYLSGDTARLHFGVSEGVTLEYLEILWPDGLISVIQAVERQTLYQIERTTPSGGS